MSHKAKKEKIPCSIEFNTPTQNHFHDFMGNWYPPNWNDSVSIKLFETKFTEKHMC